MAKAKKLPSGAYRVYAYIGKDATGKRQYKSFTAPTAKEAERMALLYDKEQEDIALNRITLHDACTEYVSNRLNVLSPWTITTYNKYITRDIKPLSAVRIDRITAEMCQQFVSVFASTHSPKTTRSVWGFVRSVLNIYRPELRTDVRLPQKKKTSIMIPTDDQIKLANLSATDIYTKAAIALCAGLGLRRAEISALHWEDISGDTLHIRRSMAKETVGDVSRWVEKAPKTTAGDRVLTLPTSVSTLLKTLPRSNKSPYIVPIDPDAITKRWCNLRKVTGIQCRFYDLRHYYASTMLALGIPDLYAMERMGHSTPTMLKTVYQHIQDEKQRSVAEMIDSKVDALFTP